ncbi:hypothetical protein Patl1_06031 [Pistacia atlantica]|uniref:Uncharacterized protein n=1 Tax=Pistacia atlantica TaxID=434234 RepID=A0ACC1BU72_9ROSI|nr:hypothetical protein Patl1_06031 [Pistacia atlantica]
MASRICFSPNHLLHSSSLFVPSSKLNPFTLSQISKLSPCHSSFSALNRNCQIKLKHPPRASAEGVPSELMEDSKFVPLNADDPVYGPPALLLLGFEVEEKVKVTDISFGCIATYLLILWTQHVAICVFLLQIRELLTELGGEFMEVLFCTEDMIPLSLWEAMNTKQPDLEAVKIAESLPRICFLSGLSGEEMLMFIEVFPETGLEPPVFAALVPNSADKTLQELIEEIMGDHEMLTGRNSTRWTQTKIRYLKIRIRFPSIRLCSSRF